MSGEHPRRQMICAVPAWAPPLLVATSSQECRPARARPGRSSRVAGDASTGAPPNRHGIFPYERGSGWPVVFLQQGPRLFRAWQWKAAVSPKGPRY